MKTHVVISHYNEDINWVHQLIHPYTVISKQTKNVGTENWSYVSFIIQNYDNLPDKILFVHGHENSYHQSYSTPYIANHLNWSKLQYVNVNDHYFWRNRGNEEGLQYFVENEDYEDVDNNYRRSYRLWFTDNWEDAFGNYIKRPTESSFLGFGQFMVSKQLILRHPIDFYKRLLNWLETTDIDERMYIGDIKHFNKAHAYVSGRLCEYNWHYIFTSNPHEQLTNYIV